MSSPATTTGNGLALPYDYIGWVLVDVVLFVVIVLGNVLTILAVRLSRRLRKVTSNHFVLSLAFSDLMVGLALSYHVFFFLRRRLNELEITCILRFEVFTLACCASFFNVTAIAVDRYVAIVHPLKHPRFATKRVVCTTIVVSWIVSLIIATVPVYWNSYNSTTGCEFAAVLPRYYAVAILSPMFLVVWSTIFVLYFKIWKEAQTHTRRWKRNGMDNCDSSDWKSIQVVLLILGCFSVCWLPYVIVVSTRVLASQAASSPTIYRVMFSLAMCNSGMNPIIYAWKNRSFRKAFHHLLRCRTPDHDLYNASFKNYLRKQSELSKREHELEDRKASKDESRSNDAPNGSPTIHEGEEVAKVSPI